MTLKCNTITSQGKIQIWEPSHFLEIFTLSHQVSLMDTLVLSLSFSPPLSPPCPVTQIQSPFFLRVRLVFLRQRRPPSSAPYQIDHEKQKSLVLEMTDVVSSIVQEPSPISFETRFGYPRLLNAHLCKQMREGERN